MAIIGTVFFIIHTIYLKDPFSIRISHKRLGRLMPHWFSPKIRIHFMYTVYLRYTCLHTRRFYIFASVQALWQILSSFTA